MRLPSRASPTAATLLALTSSMLADLSIGLAVVTIDGTPLWFNNEAAVICEIWDGGSPRGVDTLPLARRSRFHLPNALRQACRMIASSSVPDGKAQRHTKVSDPDRGLYALLQLHPASLSEERQPVCFLRLDYRRPRGDRDKAIPAAGLQLLNQLSFREREVALRLRDGLSNREIASVLRRSPLTIKSQVRSIFEKLGINKRTKVTALLNR